MSRCEFEEIRKARDQKMDINALTDRLYDEITTPGTVPNFDADEVILFTIRKLNELGLLRESGGSRD